MGDAAIPSIPSDIIFNFGTFHITNSVLTSFLVSIVIIIGAFIISRGMKVVPTKGQLVVEMILEYFLGALTDAFGTKKRAKKYLPWILTMFLFLIVVNQFSIVPLLRDLTVTGAEGTFSLFRVSSSDWSLPLAMALVVVLATQIIALMTHPLRHIGNYIRIAPFFKIKKLADIPFAFIEFFLGLLDIISEIAKVVSLSARLFGNIFAGEVMFVIMAGLVAFIVPMPFVILSIFSGLVQAYVFAFLSLQFMAITIRGAEPEPAAAT